MAPGDKVLVTLTPGGDASAPVTAARVILMKAQAIAANHAADEAAWAKGGGGIVKSVDPAAGTIVIASGLKTVTVTVTPQTIVRRYSGESVRFADAKVSTIGEIHKGDQLRVRGTRSADGSTITADELVTGSFRNFSGLITVDRCCRQGTVTLKDLATKKSVTIAVGAEQRRAADSPDAGGAGCGADEGRKRSGRSATELRPTRTRRRLRTERSASGARAWTCRRCCRGCRPRRWPG